jgi:hypothetical protein
MSISSAGLSDCEKRRRLATRDRGPRGPPATNQTNPRQLVVRPTPARRMLGNIGPDRLWRLIKAGEIDSYLVGRSRFITVESIERYIAQQLAEAHDKNGRIKLYDHGAERAGRTAA